MRALLATYIALCILHTIQMENSPYVHAKKPDRMKCEKQQQWAIKQIRNNSNKKGETTGPLTLKEKYQQR